MRFLAIRVLVVTSTLSLSAYSFQQISIVYQQITNIDNIAKNQTSLCAFFFSLACNIPEK